MLIVDFSFELKDIPNGTSPDKIEKNKPKINLSSHKKDTKRDKSDQGRETPKVKQDLR